MRGETHEPYDTLEIACSAEMVPGSYVVNLVIRHYRNQYTHKLHDIMQDIQGAMP